MSYTPPTGSAADHEFGAAYTVPTGDDINVVLGGGAGQYILGVGDLDALGLGTWTFSYSQFVTVPSLGDLAEYGSIQQVFPRYTVDHNWTSAYTAPYGLWIPEAPGATTCTLSVTGISTAQFGTAAIRNASQVVALLSLDASQRGVHTVANISASLAPAGLDAAEFGTADVGFAQRHVYTDGVDAAEFGTQSVELFEREVSVIGLDAAELGTQFVRENGAYDLTAGSAAELGTPAVSNFRRYLEPAGLDANTFPAHDHAVSHFHRTITQTGRQSATMGTQKVEYKDRTRAPAGFSAAKFGTHWVSNYTRYLEPAGFDHVVVWDEYGPWPPGRVGFPGVQVTGLDAARVGQPTMTRITPTLGVWPQGLDSLTFHPPSPYITSGENLTPEWGIDSAQFGVFEIDFDIARLRPVGIDAHALGTLTLSSSATLAPTGMSTQVIGALTVSSLAAVAPAGLDPHALGALAVSSRATAAPAGLDSSAFGAPVVTSRATVAPAGINSLETWALYAADFFAEDYVANDSGITVAHL